MSASNHDADAGMSLAARTAAAATAAAKQLGSVLGFTRQSPSPSQVPPSPPTPVATASSVKGLGAVWELTLSEDGKKGKDCEDGQVGIKDSTIAGHGKKGKHCEREQEGAAAVKVSREDGQAREEKDKKAGKGRGNKGKPYPLRPGEPDCAFYIRTGKCAYGHGCKFNHPPDWWKNAKAQPRGTPESDKISIANAAEEDKESRQVKKIKCKYFASPKGCKYGYACSYSHYVEKMDTEIELNFLGLPIRPGEKECPLYMETGACKDSTSCKYNHPNPTTFSGDSDQPQEFSGSGTSLRPDYGNAPWLLESTSHALYPYIDASLPYLQGMPAMHQISQPNDWHVYQASIDPWLNRGSGQNLPDGPSEGATKCWVNDKDHPGARNDCKGNEEFHPASTYGIMTDGKAGEKHPTTAAINVTTESGGLEKSLPVPNANATTKIVGSGKHTSIDAASHTFKGTGTGKMSTSSLLHVPLEAAQGKKKQKQPSFANPPNMTKSNATDKPVSIPNFILKEQRKEQPHVSIHSEDVEQKQNRTKTTSHCLPKSMGSGNKIQGDAHHDGTKVKQCEKKPTKNKGNQNNPMKNSGNESQLSKCKNNDKQPPVARVHYVQKGKTKEDLHSGSIDHADSKGKGNESNSTKNSGNESQPSKLEKNEKYSPVARAHCVPEGKAEQEQYRGSLDDSDGKGNKSNSTKNNGNESQPTKSKKNEKQSPVVSVHYAPKAKETEEQHLGSTDHDEDKGNGNQFSVPTPMILVSARKKGKHFPVATSHNSTNSDACGKDSLVDISTSDRVVNEKMSGKPLDDVNLSDAAKKTDDSISNQPTQLTELPRRPGKPECPHYLKKGGCKYKSCKFDHPKDPNQIQISSKCLLSPQGLPLRPGVPICTHYSQSGICTYGPVCKYNHPFDVVPSKTVAK